jgi:hypothetical protein
MKLLKLPEEHYIVADKLDIKVGDWITDKYSVYQWRDNSSLLGRMKVTHSTQPLGIIHGDNNKETISYGSIGHLSISEVREVLGIVDVNRKAYRFRRDYQDSFDCMNECIMNDAIHRQEGYIAGYNQSLEDNKKKYTEEDLRNAISFGNNIQYTRLAISGVEKEIRKFIQSLQSPTEWDVEIIDGKLKLK